MDPRSQEFSAAKRAGKDARFHEQPAERRAAARRAFGLVVRILLRYAFRFFLLTLATALLTYGLLDWAGGGFDFEGILLYDNDWRPHPLHITACGLAMLPPSIWEIFQLEILREGHAGDGNAASPDAQ